MATTRVKICGTTSAADAVLAAECGADYVGLVVEHPPSPRHVTLAQAADIAEACPVQTVAVTVNLPVEEIERISSVVRPHAVQLHGDESVDVVTQLAALLKCHLWKVLHLPKEGQRAGLLEELLLRAEAYRNAGVSAILLDTAAASRGRRVFGGSGEVGDWSLAAQLIERVPLPVVLAGGLSPRNVANAIQQCKPWCVDVVSGVEARKGLKNPKLVREFIEAVRGE